MGQQEYTEHRQCNLIGINVHSRVNLTLLALRDWFVGLGEFDGKSCPVK